VGIIQPQDRRHLCFLYPGSLAVYAYSNRIAPLAGTVSLLIAVIVTAAFLLLAGTSTET